MKHIKIEIPQKESPAPPIKDAKGLYQVVETLLRDMAEQAHVKDLDRYFSVEAKLDLRNKKAKSLEEIFHRLIGSLQNRNMMPSVIQYWNKDRGPIIRDFVTERYLKKSDVPYPTDENALILYTDIKQKLQKEKITIKEKDDKPSKLWLVWCKGILSAARFLNQFADISELHACFAQLCDDHRTRSVLPAMLAMEIDGMQFTLACDFLKECGYDYPKPDVHITDVFEEICGTRDTYPIYKKVIEYAEAIRKSVADPDMTAYKLDKMIWLICSGNFYMEGQKLSDGGHEGIEVGSYKDELLECLGMTPLNKRPWYVSRQNEKKIAQG